jgi:hypothetical protein
MQHGFAKALILVSTIAACSPAPDLHASAIFSQNIKAEHRLFEVQPIRSATSCLVGEHNQAPSHEFLEVTVLVRKDGRASVQRVRDYYDESGVTTRCTRIARSIVASWRYRPFISASGPTVVEFAETIPVYPLERWRSPRVEFPAHYELTSARIILNRSGCLGTCPVYRVEIRGDGACRFEGAHFVRVQGVRECSVDPTEVARLIEQFRSADFYSLFELYEAPITDHPYYRLTLELDGRSHTVTDYVGEMAGMPSAVVALERRVDELAHTSQWIGSER